jgi:hypothetical protein
MARISPPVIARVSPPVMARPSPPVIAALDANGTNAIATPANIDQRLRVVALRSLISRLLQRLEF